MMFCWCTLVLLTLVPVVTGQNSGVKVKLTQRGLDLVAGKATEKLKQYIQQMDFPDKSFIFELYTVTGVKIHIDRLHSVQTFVPNTGVTFTINSANLNVTGNLTSPRQGRSPLELIVDTLDITATVAVKSDETAHLKLSIENCKATFQPFKVDSGSRLVKKIDWFISVFPSIADKLICYMMKTTIADLNPQLNAKVREYTGIDFSMEPAVISSDSFELSFVGLNGRKK